MNQAIPGNFKKRNARLVGYAPGYCGDSTSSVSVIIPPKTMVWPSGTLTVVWAVEIFLTGELSSLDHVSGWGLENTPHQNSIRRLLSARERSPEIREE